MAVPSGIPARVRAHHLFPTSDDTRRLWALAVPVVVVQLGMMLLGVVTTVMVGHVSATDLAAAALGNLCVVWLALLGWGTVMGLDPIVAQAHGAGDRAGVARAVQRGLVLAVAVSAVTALLFLPVRPVLVLLRQPADVVPLAARYVEVSIPGIFPFFLFLVLRQSLQAMGRMRAIVIVILGANVLNAALGWALIFGRLGSPALGAVGAGLAATVSRFALALGLLALAWRDLRPLLRPLRREALDRAALARMVRLGLPIGLQMQLEYGVFAFVALLMGRLGTVPMAAHQIALTIASVTFMATASTGVSVVKSRASGPGSATSARPQSSMKAAPAPSAATAARRARAPSPAPTAWPTSTAAAPPMPCGTMKVTEAMVRAIWCAAMGTVPSRPMSRATKAKTPYSSCICRPIGSPRRTMRASAARSSASRRSGRSSGRRSRQASASSPSARAKRLTVAARPAPTTPRAGLPRCPKTSAQPSPALNTFAPRMVTTMARMRPMACRLWRSTRKTKNGKIPGIETSM